jgi:hypothetical protein
MMPHTDCKLWATSRPESFNGDMEEVVEKFVTHKWKDALDVATAECRTSRLGSSRVQGRETCNCEAGKKPWEDLELPCSKQSKERRESQFFRSLGCDKDHPAFTFELLKMQEPEAKKKALQDSGLFLFCMRHSADSECFGKGMNTTHLQGSGVQGLHAESLYDLLTREVSTVNAVDTKRMMKKRRRDLST